MRGPVVAPEIATPPEGSVALAADMRTLTPVHHTTVKIHVAPLAKGLGAVGADEGLGSLVHCAHVRAQRPALRKPLPALHAPESALPAVHRRDVSTQMVKQATMDLCGVPSGYRNGRYSNGIYRWKRD